MGAEGAALELAHLRVLEVVSTTLPLPPLMPNKGLVPAPRAYAQPNWLSVTLLLAITRIAPRDDGPVFPSATKLIWPGPLRMGSEVIVTHGVSDVLFHGHPAVVVTEMFPPPPATPTLPASGDTRYEHAAEAVCGVAATVAVARTSRRDRRITRERAGACCE